MRRWTPILAITALAVGALPSGCVKRLAVESSPQQLQHSVAHARNEREDFDRLFDQWKRLLSELRTLDASCRGVAAENADGCRKACADLIDEGSRMQEQLVESAVLAYVRAPADNEDLSYFLKNAVFVLIAREEYEEALRLGQLLVDNYFEDGDVYNSCGLCAFYTGEFRLAEQHLQRAKEARALTGVGLNCLRQIPYYQEAWAVESKLRSNEQMAGDLPRVLLVTTQGEIELDLFENEAPNTVANFLTLVDKGFYDGLKFFRVVQGQSASCGCPEGNGKGGPGYTIHNECNAPLHRLHFRGSLGMARSDNRTHGSQFYLAFVPIMQRDGTCTVFGRVVRGLDVLAKLQRREPPSQLMEEINPHGYSVPPSADAIVKASVVRKRGHAYLPVTRPSPKKMTVGEAIEKFINTYGP